MTRWIENLLIAGLFITIIVAESCEVNAGQRKGPDVGLWLARSCVGEAGFDSVQTGECAAILHVYLKRTEVSGLGLYKIVRKYSAAVKGRPSHRHRWVLHLSRDVERAPKHWADNSSWKVMRSFWVEVLALCDDFLDGRVHDPLPFADHYGGRMDRHRAMREGWYRLKTNYRNEFWSMTNPNKKEVTP